MREDRSVEERTAFLDGIASGCDERSQYSECPFVGGGYWRLAMHWHQGFINGRQALEHLRGTDVLVEGQERFTGSWRP